MNEKPACTKCKTLEVVKKGKVAGKQRVKCKKCAFQFTRLTPRGRPATEKAMAVILYNLGLSMNAIAKLFKVSTPAVLAWIKNFAIANYENLRQVRLLSLELMKCGIFKKKKNNLWIWKAYYRETGELIDWECGGRDKKTSQDC